MNFATNVVQQGPKIANIFTDEDARIVQGLELPPAYRGEKYVLRDIEEGETVYGVGSGQDRSIEVWKLSDLVPGDVQVGLFSHHALNPRGPMDLGGVVGPVGSTEAVIRNANGEIYYSNLEVLAEMADKVE